MKKLLLAWDYGVKNWVLTWFKKILFTKVSRFTSGNILIFRTGSIGDSICALPAIYSIRKNFPHSRIQLLTNPAGKNVSVEYLLDKSLGIEIINYQGLGFLKLLALLKWEKIDLFVELPQTHASFKTNLRNLITAKLIGARYGMGWQVYCTLYFKNFQQFHHHFLPETERLLGILSAEGLPTFPQNFPLAITKDHEAAVNSLLSEHSLLDRSKNIAIVTGAKRSTNRWPIVYFQQLVNQLSSEGYNLLLIGGNDDLEIVKPLLEIPRVYSLVGKLTPLESAVAINHCILSISNDTGPMHLSYAVGTPLIGIYSARDYPVQWYPPSFAQHKVFRHPHVACAICLLESCPHDNACLRAITPEMVLQEAHLQLSKT
ncbi:MAG: glycosyltransferase family 9 protein [Cytophagales bacterium]|nr:glycosyltransferase family 9 protein [Cytophagales bacterium]